MAAGVARGAGMIGGLLAAIGFLTRVPVPPRVFDDPRAQVQSLAWYPLVGLLLGGVLAVLAWMLHGAPPLLAAALVLVAWVALTGALHLDGLADSADAWVGGLGDRARTLQIMKDPRCGPLGVVAIVLTLLLKFAALASLSAHDGSAHGWPALLLAPMLARGALTAAFLSTPYVRADGLGRALPGAPRHACIGTLALAIAASLAWARGPGALAVLVAVAVFALWRRACRQRLGGMTGDTCGALAELVETAVLVACAVG